MGWNVVQVLDTKVYDGIGQRREQNEDDAFVLQAANLANCHPNFRSLPYGKTVAYGFAHDTVHISLIGKIVSKLSDAMGYQVICDALQYAAIRNR